MSSDGISSSYKRGVAGSNPAAPTCFRRPAACCDLEVIVREQPRAKRGAKVDGDLVHGRACEAPAWHRDAAFVCKLIPGGHAWQRMPALAESLRWLGRRAEILDGCRRVRPRPGTGNRGRSHDHWLRFRAARSLAFRKITQAAGLGTDWVPTGCRGRCAIRSCPCSAQTGQRRTSPTWSGTGHDNDRDGLPQGDRARAAPWRRSHRPAIYLTAVTLAA
jgi:hypothetical protein